MNKFKGISDEEVKEWIEIKVKVPKNTLGIIVNYLCNKGLGEIEMGNIRYDKEDIDKNIIDWEK